MKEREALSVSGWGILVLDIAIFALAARAFISAFTASTVSEWLIVVGSALTIVGVVIASGFTQIEPNIARVVIFLGRYAGTIRRTGFVWTVPLTTKPSYSLRLRNFESQALDQLSEKQIVNLDEERKAAMVSNLLVVLCSEHGTQPVVNAGSLYQ